MSDLRDDQYMRRIDELLLAGEPVPEEPELTALVSAVRSLADAPAPLPSPELERVLSEGSTAVGATSLARHRRRRRMVARITLGAAIAAAAATGAAALELPGSVQEPARSFFSGVADLFAPGRADPPQPEPEPDAGRPAPPAGDEPAEGKPPANPAGDPEDRRPATPGPATPQAPGNPGVNPGPPQDPGHPENPGLPVAPGPPGHVDRDPASERPAENPYPDPAHRR